MLGGGGGAGEETLIFVIPQRMTRRCLNGSGTRCNYAYIHVYIRRKTVAEVKRGNRNETDLVTARVVAADYGESPGRGWRSSA